MAEEVPRTSKKSFKNQALKRVSSDQKDQNPMKQYRRGKSSGLVAPASNWLVCGNPACRATQSTDLKFCKRCSCCICHKFDENKDPSLWLECTPESGSKDSCGFSCHIECVLQPKSGVNLPQLRLDGSYCCASCHKVSSIIGCWKKQLAIAKDAQRVDVLCYRIFLSYRLLDGTSRFKELHKFIKDLKAELERELGPINEAAAEMSRGLVSRLHAVGCVKRLCSLAIEKADELLTSNSNPILNCNEGSVPSTKPQNMTRTEIKLDSGFKVQDTGKSPSVVFDKGKEPLEGLCGTGTKICDGVGGDVQPETLPDERLQTMSTEFDLNSSPMLNLNEELGQSDAMNRSQFLNDNVSGISDDNFEYIVKTICALEHGGHISREFRLQFLTWFSLRSNEQERRVVSTFVKILIDDPSSLGGQLVDTFSDIISRSRP